MKSFSSLSVMAPGVLVAVLTAWGGGRVANPSAGVAEPLRRSDGGGAFAARYSGSASSKSCGYECIMVTLSGAGHASFLHKSTQSETLKIECAVQACSATGTATLVSRSNPADTISIELGSIQGETDYGDWGVTGGTGKFVNASGSGHWQTQDYSGGTYSQSLSGTLNF